MTQSPNVQQGFANIPADEQVLNKLSLLNFNPKFKLTEC